MREFNRLIPEKIDRSDNQEAVLGKITPNSFGLLPSNKNWDERRKLATKTIGINFASKYIPMMISTVDEWSKNIKINESIDFTTELKRITFNIITKILFGRDIDKMDKWVYVSPNDGSTTLLNFDDAYFKYTFDELMTAFSLKFRAFPILSKLKMIEPFKSNNKNNKAIYSALKKFLDMSDDDQSVYRQLLNSGLLSKEEVFHDTILLLFAGFDTTSHGICSALYCLHKFPETLGRLKEALNKNGITNIDVKKEDMLKDYYENCDYLAYKIKIFILDLKKCLFVV